MSGYYALGIEEDINMNKTETQALLLMSLAVMIESGCV